MSDEYRRLSKSSFKKFMDGGSCAAFTDLVRKHPSELALCFRGNSGNKAVVYYNNHIVFSISAQGIVSVSFDHARFCENWKEFRDRLRTLGFTVGDPKPKTYKSGSLSYSVGNAKRGPEKGILAIAEVETLYFDVVRPMIDRYFSAKEDGTYDQFLHQMKGVQRFASKNYVEKMSQQRLFTMFKDLDDGYCFYDMEYSEPNGAAKDSTNEPDMLAIRFQDGKPVAIVFVEVKSTKAALGGTSGLHKHIWGMANYPKVADGASLQIRREDACEILNQYAKLRLLSTHVPFSKDSFMDLPFEMLLVFTDELAGYQLDSVPDGMSYKKVTSLPAGLEASVYAITRL